MSHLNWYSVGEVALLLKTDITTISRRIRIQQIPAIKDEYMECYFIHQSVVDYLIDSYYPNKRYTSEQLQHMKQLHKQALGEQP